MKANYLPFLIHPSILNKSLKHIQHKLNNEYPGFYISQTDPKFYYSSSNFIYSKHKYDIFVIIKILISFKRSDYDLYRVISLPVPINLTDDATQLLNIPNFIAVSKTADYFVQLSNTDIASCSRDNKNFHCPINQSFDTTKDSCLIAIFTNDKSKVKQLCNF